MSPHMRCGRSASSGALMIGCQGWCWQLVCVQQPLKPGFTQQRPGYSPCGGLQAGTPPHTSACVGFRSEGGARREWALERAQEGWAGHRESLREPGTPPQGGHKPMHTMMLRRRRPCVHAQGRGACRTAHVLKLRCFFIAARCMRPSVWAWCVCATRCCDCETSDRLLQISLRQGSPTRSVKAMLAP